MRNQPIYQSSDVSALILAGGSSRRMGENKALLEITGQFFIERVINAVRPLADDILLISNDPDPYTFLHLPIIPDIQPDYGPLMGLYSGLSAARHELTLLLACDMPFVQTAFLRHMLVSAKNYDVVVPKSEEGLHALHAFYRRSTCLPAIEQALKQGKRRTISFYDQVQVLTLGKDDYAPFDPLGVALMNVNTPEQLKIARKVARDIINHPSPERGDY